MSEKLKRREREKIYGDRERESLFVYLIQILSGKSEINSFDHFGNSSVKKP